MQNAQLPPHMQQQAQTEIFLEGARWFEIPATQPLFHRPMQFNSSADTILQLQNATHGGDLINPMALREIAKDVVRPSIVPEGQLTIANGWGISRFAVFLLFRITAAGRTYHEVITGYTDHPDVSMSNMLDPNCRIYINSHIRINEGMSFGPGGGAAGLTVASDTNVITPVGIITNDNQQVAGAFTQRPTDVLTGWQMGISPTSNQTWDPRGSVDPQLNGGFGLASSRNNHGSAHYLARIFKGVKDAKDAVGNFSPNSTSIATEQMIVGQAAVSAADNEKDFSSLALFRMLSERTSYTTAQSFSPQELFNAVGHDHVNWQAVAPPQSLPKGPGHATSLADNSEGWGNYLNETSVAHQLAHGVPALCGRNMLASYSFTAFGSFSHNQHVCNYEHGTSLFKVNDQFETNSCMTVKNLMEQIILPEIFYGICDNYQISVSYTIAGTINMDVSLDSGASISYSAPNYCDHMSAPTVAVDNQVVKNNGMVVKHIVEEVFTSGNAPMTY